MTEERKKKQRKKTWEEQRHMPGLFQTLIWVRLLLLKVNWLEGLGLTVLGTQ